MRGTAWNTESHARPPPCPELERHSRQTVSDDWIRALPLTPASDVLDIGCGRAALLERIAETHGYRCVGVDRNEHIVLDARRSLMNTELAERIDLRAESFDEAAFSDASFDVLACLEATHAVSDLRGVLRTAGRLLRPGGVLVVADGHWRRRPDEEYLAFLACSEDDIGTLESNAALAREAGFTVERTHETTDDEWSRYEDMYAANILAFVDAHPEDPDAAEFRTHISAWRQAYLAWGRTTLGFAVYQLRLLP
ncbi:MAG: methyltransferase domain-containing protein [bacterium]|nr:methyltransferase domain-containing protein [bacterium]